MDVRMMATFSKTESGRDPEEGFWRLLTFYLLTRRTVMKLNVLSPGRGVPDGSSENQGRGKSDTQRWMREKFVMHRDQGRSPCASPRDRGTEMLATVAFS